MTINDEDRAAGITPIDQPPLVQRLADNVGGTISECARLPDGPGFAVVSMPLPATHWSTQPRQGFYEAPPMPFRMGSDDKVTVAVFPNAGWPDRSRQMTRPEMAEIIWAAGQYAYRSATMNGTESDLDPDALLQNLVVAFLGYWSHDGRTDDEWALPPQEQGKRAKP